jgi:hypothetical protein
MTLQEPQRNWRLVTAFGFGQNVVYVEVAKHEVRVAAVVYAFL